MTKSAQSAEVIPLFPGAPPPPKAVPPGTSWAKFFLKEAEALPCTQLAVIHDGLLAITEHLSSIGNQPRSDDKTRGLMLKMLGVSHRLSRDLVMIAYGRAPEDKWERRARAAMIIQQSLLDVSGNADIIIQAVESLQTEEREGA